MEVQFTSRRSAKPARFPNAIREYRLKAGLSQQRLAILVGRARSLVSSWEHGHVLPTLPNVFRLARALGTLAESLYTHLYHPASDDPSNNPKER